MNRSEHHALRTVLESGLTLLNEVEEGSHPSLTVAEERRIGAIVYRLGRVVEAILRRTTPSDAEIDATLERLVGDGNVERREHNGELQYRLVQF